MKKFLFFLLVLISFTFISACDFTPSKPVDPVEQEEDVKRITTQENYIDMYIGTSIYLKYSLNFKLGEDEEITLTSADPSICKVYSDGQVMALSKGSTIINVYYSEDVQINFFITVLQHIEIQAPIKTDYYVGEELDLTGCTLSLYNTRGVVTQVIDVIPSMVSGFDSSEVGEKEVTVMYAGSKYYFKVNIKELKNEAYLVDSLTFPNTIKQNEKLEIKVNNTNLSLLAEKLTSFYDYTEYCLELTITDPNKNSDKITAFYYQDYTVKKTTTTLNTSATLEGQVNSTSGYNYKYGYTKNGSACYMFRYNPETSGRYTYSLNVVVGSSVIQTLTGDFTVQTGAISKGIVKVSANKRTFVYESGDDYIPVGQNVCWYTSKERRFGDYELWFTKMSNVGSNFARVWMAPWGYSLFWSNLTDYSSRLDEAYELDELFDLAEEKGILIDLCLFNHGMFSRNINPMWSGASNTWYIGKYGVNPYSKIVDDPVDFFTDSNCKKWTKNYIQYIISRYGYSSNLMSYELFNEVDWIDNYNETAGTAWHLEMSKYIKQNDYRGHLVTSSTKDDSFGNVANMFKISTIDYACVHAYGSSNYLNYISSKYSSAYSNYNKPIMYQEVGLDGSSGSGQAQKDPSHVSLHQELWAGLMTTGSTAMNWWWDSWIQPYNCYDYFKGPAMAAELMDLSGSMTMVYNNKNAVKSSSSTSKPLGYKFGNRAYIYLYSSSYTYKSTGKSESTTITVLSLDSGTYSIKVYNTSTMALVNTMSKTASSGSISFAVSYTDDVFIAINKN